MPYLIFLLVLAYPASEIFAIFWLVGEIGGLLTFAWIAGAFFLGSMMLMHHQLAVAALLGNLRSGAITPGSLFRLARYFIAAILFIIPGPISDVIALLLLLPWGNKQVVAQSQQPADSDVIEGDFRRVDPKSQDDKLIR